MENNVQTNDIAPTDPPARTIAARQTLLRITEEGPPDGPLMLLVPGVPGGHRDFRYLAPRLAAQGFRVVRLEFPGFGGNQTAPRHSDYSAAGRAALVVAAADALDRFQFSVVGHSMGGGATLAVGGLYTDRVLNLVTIASTGISAHRGLPAPPAVIRTVVTASRWSPLWPVFTAKIRREYKRLRFADVDAISDDELMVHARCIWSQDFAASGKHARAIRCPVLLVFADDDRMIESEIGLETARVITDSHVLRFATGGHALQKSRASEIASAVAALPVLS